MKSVEWSYDAVKSLQYIYDYIYLKSPQNTEMVIETLLTVGEQLNQFPEKNPIDPIFKNDKIRFFPKWN